MSEVIKAAFSFDEVEQKLIKNYVKDGYSRIQIAKMLREHLEGRRIIDDMTTYEELTNNKSLLDALAIIIGSNLATTIGKSEFGMGKFTDHELYHKARNDDGLNLLIQGNQIIYY